MMRGALLIISIWVLMVGIVRSQHAASRCRSNIEWGLGNRPILVGPDDMHMDIR